MKIIKPSTYIVDEINGDKVIEKIEACARICYQADKKAEPGTLLRRLIKSGHHSPLEHVSVTVFIETDRGISHEIVRHRVASFCLSGCTILKSISQKQWTLKELYLWQSDIKRKGRLKLITIRSVNDQGVVVPNKIKRITYSGRQILYRVTTQSGRTIDATEHHRFLTPDGYRTLGSLAVGDYLIANGRRAPLNKEWLYDQYIVLNKTRSEVAKLAGCSESFIYKSFRRYGIVKDMSDHLSRVRPDRSGKPGRKWTNIEKRHISERMKGDGNHRWKKDETTLTKGGLQLRAYKRKNILLERSGKKCECCGKFVTNGSSEVHHINHDVQCWQDSNLMVLCIKCHKAQHKHYTTTVIRDKIMSIVCVGADDTYDVEMCDAPHNFVANSLVVHNSQSSSRFIRYCDGTDGHAIKFVCPNELQDDTLTAKQIWRQSMQDAEGQYIALLNSGVTPQIARSVLPNSLATQLYMTANLREWRHIFQLRVAGTTGKPHPDMVATLAPLLEEFKKKIPIIFDDIQPT